MKRFFNTVAAILICGALIAPQAEARGRNNNSGQGSPQRTQQPASRPGNMGRPAQPSRPAGNPSPSRPGNNSQQNRPGNGNGGNHNRPNPGNRPGNGNHDRPNHGNRPGNNRPGGPNFGGHRPDYRPDHGPGHNMHHGPMRPNMPPHHAWYRPAPPHGWRAPRYWRPFHSILGISLGTTINISINSLMNSGYAITSYGNNSVYVSNVPMLNMMWPDAVLFYNGMGGLCGSRFVYSTGFYDMNRYNMTYNSLVNAYGAPYSIQNTGAGMEATWWGTGNQFIRLAFTTDYAQNGALRYFTTLSFGN